MITVDDGARAAVAEILAEEYRQETLRREMKRRASGLAPVVIHLSLKAVGGRARQVYAVAGAPPFTPADQLEIMESWGPLTRRRKYFLRGRLSLCAPRFTLMECRPQADTSGRHEARDRMVDRAPRPYCKILFNTGRA